MAKVRIYTTSGCNFCHQAMDYLKEKGVEFESFDVGADKDAYQEMRKISGGLRSVPILAIEDKVIVGFDRPAIEEALAALSK